MAVRKVVEDIAKLTALTDAQDLTGLVALQEKLDALGDEGLSGDLEVLVEAATKASKIIDEIVLRQTDDAEASFALINKMVEYALSLLDAVDAGKSGNDLPNSPFDESDQEEGKAPNQAPIDEELLSAWVTGCEYSLSDLEGTAVEIDSAENPEDLIAEVRRTIHTLKGEAGVLSLNIAQKLCHEAESLIDLCVERGEKFPVDPILALIDWMKDYVSTLASNPMAKPPPHEQLLSVLSDGSGSESPATPTTDVSDDETPESAPSAPETIGASLADDQPVEFPADLGMDENLGDFVCEALEHLHNAEQALLELEKDFTDVEVINTVFRSFHTIKGVAGFMNLDPIVELAHNAETMLDLARNGDLELNTGLLDLILESCDLLTQLIKMFQDEPAPTKAELANLVDRLQRATKGEAVESPDNSQPEFPFPPLGEILVSMGIVTEGQIAIALERKRTGAEKLRNLIVQGGLTVVDAVECELLKNSETGEQIQGMLVEMELVDGQQLKDAIEERRNSNKRIGQLLDVTTEELAPALREQRRAQREGETPTESVPPPVSSQPSPPKQANVSKTASPASTAKAAAAKEGGAKQSLGAGNRAGQTVKVNTSRLDSLVDMVGELVIAQQMIVQDPEVHTIKEQRTKRNLAHIGKIIRDLQEVAMALRMVTVKATFQKMARLVRDVASKAGKNITFIMEGEDTELDRNVVEEISDPLVHMIRNSCDHGIEASVDRKAAGKPESGKLVLRAFHQAGSIVIEVEDDGRGLPREKIYKKAIERGLISSDRQIDDIPDSEIYNLVFLPGFSTADKVTDISGRGVGMDVVRRNIEALRGKVEIRSTPGKGSIFSIRLPLTLAIIDGMIMRVGSQRYVVPTLAIEQSFRPTPDELHTVNDKGEMVSVRGSLLPIHRLNRIFNVQDSIEELSNALLVVLESATTRSCLMVDEIIGQQQVVIKSLGQGVKSIRGVSGGAILGDGRVALILDVDGLVREATSNNQAISQPENLRLAKAA